jgi:hypothetical protein
MQCDRVRVEHHRGGKGKYLLQADLLYKLGNHENIVFYWKRGPGTG